VHFRVIERRQTIPELIPLGYDEVRDGFLDAGMKDTFLLMPGERVSIQVAFAQQKGRYVYHCHNLEHEDQGLMRNYEVT
jgi:blue copper oxidase